MATIYIDGKAYDADPDKNLLETALSHGLDLPYFCWHPAMHSVGACRQCAVKRFKDKDDKNGRIVMSCMEAANDGAIISIEDAEAKAFRGDVVEWLMTNHPHDCPTCDEGGECHLQDMTVMTGHNYRRYRYHKRTYRNQNLGPCINHEMNRCIQCYRCVRYYQEYAGGKDLDVFSAHNHVYFGRQEDGTLQSEFSGNLVEVCPTGVFTDKTLKKHYTRKWDFTSAPSICNQCSLGCNIIPGERYGELRRIQSRYNGAVNGYFICDRGRFGYEYVNSEERIREPLVNKSGTLQTTSVEGALDEINKIISSGKKVIGIGSAKASLESNFMLRQLVGEDHFYHGISKNDWQFSLKALEIMKNYPVHTPSMKETENADGILILGEDLINSAPRLGLSLRQATRNKGFKKAEKVGIPKWHDHAVRELVQDERSPLYQITTHGTKLDEISQATLHVAPEDIARLGFAIAHAIDNTAPTVESLNKEEQNIAEQIAKDLEAAGQPLVVCGNSCQNEAILQAAANISLALYKKGKKNPYLSIVFPQANSLGMAMMGGKSIEEMDPIEADTLVVIDQNLYDHLPEESVDQLFGNVSNRIMLAQLKNKMSEKATVVLPCGTFAESDGTLVNNEGRAQRFLQVFVPKGDIKERWRWLGELLALKGDETAKKLGGFDDYMQWLIKELPQFEGIQEAAKPSGFRINGQKIPRESHRYSGRTAMHANENVSEQKPPEDPDAPLSYTMEGYHGEPPSADVPYFWSPGWNSQQSINKFQIEVGGHLHGGDPGKRMIEMKENGSVAYFNELPKKFEAQKDMLQMLPKKEIFGSEPTSMISPAIRERAGIASVSINEATASNSNVKAGEELKIVIGNKTITLPVTIDKTLPEGIALLPVDRPGIDFIHLPQFAKISKA